MARLFQWRNKLQFVEWSAKWVINHVSDQPRKWSTKIEWVINLASENRQKLCNIEIENRVMINRKSDQTRAINDTDMDHLSDQSEFPLEINWSLSRFGWLIEKFDQNKLSRHWTTSQRCI